MEKARRQAALCALLAEEPGAFTVEALAARLAVSRRTVQRDLGEMRRRGIEVARQGDRLCLVSIKEDAPQATAPATEREVRQLSLLKWIYEEPGSLAPAGLCERGARRFEVCERTILRDLASLQERGLIDLREGRYYPGGGFLPRLTLSPDQALALLSYLDIQRQLLPRGEALRSAEEKLRSCLLGEAGSSVLREAEGRHNPVRLVKGRYYLQPPEIEERVDLLERACQERRLVSFFYTTLAGEASQRTVAPLGLVYYWFHDAWYLVAGGRSAQGQEALRHFRLDRMTDVGVMQETFTPPEGFDLQGHLAPCWGVERGELHRVRIRFYDEYNVMARLKRETAHRTKAKIEEEGSGSVIYTDEVSGLHEIRVWVRSFGSSAEVLEPAELREELIESVRRIVARYGGR
ncbi:MAG: WYL domain-containing protein [Bacillota bacterium]|nr:WYL domain-containing protein [Bacillota bacterium]